MIYHGNHGVLKQVNHGKIPRCFETGKTGKRKFKTGMGGLRGGSRMENESEG